MYKQINNEEELKSNIANDWFSQCRYRPGIDKIDAVFEYPKINGQRIVFAEAKHRPTDINVMFAQLIFTIYRIKNEEFLPKYLCVFDNEKIAFIETSFIEPLFDEYKNADFDWTVTPSNHNTKEFKEISRRIEQAIKYKETMFEQENLLDIKDTLFYFNKKQDREFLTEWIRRNIFTETHGGPMRINDTNFNKVYNAWLKDVKHSIDEDWDAIRTEWGILDCDYFLADLFASDNRTIIDNLAVFVQLREDHYWMKDTAVKRQIFNTREVKFNDKQKSHKLFWNRFERPPLTEFWDLILKRRDLLVPLDIRERLGAFFTPPQWVELSQQYLADTFGNNWQEEYYIWDCAAGTGNLLQGLDENCKHNVFASDINIENVYVMRGRILDRERQLNLLERHIFQFDFLNDNFGDDNFSKLPPDLLKIINNEEKRKKLIIYINPPYAEATNARTITRTGNNRVGVSTDHKQQDYYEKYGNATNELFAKFFIRINEEIPTCKLASFGTLKYVNSSNFVKFREHFKAKFKKGFMVPANTFDNVQGQFPIGFLIWDLGIEKPLKQISLDVFDVKMKVPKDIIRKEIKEIKRKGKKKFYSSYPNTINKWIPLLNNKNGDIMGYLDCETPDVQHNKFIHIASSEQTTHNLHLSIDKQSLIYACIYLSVRHCIPATWLNDRDQFLYPKDIYKKDKEFHNDCLAFTLFHSQNRITSKDGINHWIPFKENEVNAQELFDSHFMVDFMNGKVALQANGLYEEDGFTPIRSFSKEAKNVFDAGRALWKYYHTADFSMSDDEYNVNASLYDIRKHFQGESKGRMKNKSTDERYTELMNELREALQILAKKKIEPKVYKYEFLLE